MSRRHSISRQARRTSEGTGAPRTSLRDWLSEPMTVARRGEVWGVVQLALDIERRNRWPWRLWRWLTGSPLVNINPFRLWARMTGAPAETRTVAEVGGNTQAAAATEPAPRGEQLPPPEERRIVTL